MIVDFFRHGSGLSKGCLDYLLGEDREREHAQVLSGDVDLTAQLIDSSPFTKKYTSGCLSFYEHDLSDPDKQKIMQDFERCLFPGLDQDQYQILWVQHQDKVNQETGETRLELNFVIPNVELSTGKRLQPFYAPVDLDRVDLFKKITNVEYELYDPDDPNNKQLLINKKNLPQDIKDFKEQLHQRICQAVIHGKVADRQTLVEWLESNEVKVTRESKQSISIENPYGDAKRPIRLNGEMYEQGFRATGEYRQEIQQRIAEYRGTTSERYRANVTDYQRQLEHKSQYHRKRYPTVGRYDLSAHSEQLKADRDTVRPVPSLATVKIEPFKANERGNTDSRESSTEQTSRKEVEPFEYGADFSSSYFNYSRYCARIYGEKQIQRDPNPEYEHQRETTQSRSPEHIGGQSEHQYMQTDREQIPTAMHLGQRETGQIWEWLLHSNGVLKDDRTRSAIIENYRRTTDAIAAATAKFRIDANESYERVVGTVKSNRDHAQQLTADTKVIRDNSEAISRSTARYNAVHGTDREQSAKNGADHDLQRASIATSLTDAKRNLSNSTAITAELARNFGDIEANIIKMMECKKEIEKPQPKKDRGMDFGM
ncbi:relaxase/mobilization nuclease domain-containing protein [Acinetobacter sp. YH12131]|uniref:relaxase/mobilization nuclease domain-containing protein n=1 Tax=Acinetobacter sp. YH12131 TaxID=2601115 RepID=UPI0015D412FA|nr:relaxase/mobilization nuclease domain-containing protein [Acinetobacter sp. YH12131]